MEVVNVMVKITAKMLVKMTVMMTARRDPVSALAPCLVRQDPVAMLNVIFATLMANSGSSLDMEPGRPSGEKGHNGGFQPNPHLFVHILSRLKKPNRRAHLIMHFCEQNECTKGWKRCRKTRS